MAIETSNLALPVEPVTPASSAAEDDPVWYKDALIYQVHVKSFFDSNHDGVGDFAGLTQKLDYLQSLGITCLWLLPFFPSPLKDDGYDIADYCSVHPSYGTLDDFKALVRAAHERRIKVLIELVVNHTSDQHPWFQRARHAPAGSPERNFYVWSDTDKKFPETRIIFCDTERSNWSYDPIAKQYYWHRFFSHQPDLNHNNPAVVEAAAGWNGLLEEFGRRDARKGTKVAIEVRLIVVAAIERQVREGLRPELRDGVPEAKNPRQRFRCDAQFVPELRDEVFPARPDRLARLALVGARDDRRLAHPPVDRVVHPPAPREHRQRGQHHADLVEQDAVPRPPQRR